MDYIPVYEGDDTDDGSVKLSPGKIQRTGVKSEPAARRVIRTLDPGARHDPARRAARFGRRDAVRRLHPEGRQRHTGQHVSQGPAADGGLQPGGFVSAAAEYLVRHHMQAPPARGAEGRAAAAAGEPRRAGAGHRGASKARAKSRLSIPWLAPQDGEMLERNAVERHARRSPATCCSGLPIIAWSGRWSTSPNAISAQIAIGHERRRQAARASGPRRSPARWR